MKLEDWDLSNKNTKLGLGNTNTWSGLGKDSLGKSRLFQNVIHLFERIFFLVMFTFPVAFFSLLLFGFV